MERNKRILLQALVLLSFLTLCSCIDKVVYTYEDVVITRYDCLGFMDGRIENRSVFYCNKSDKTCKIEITGSQNYYQAWLCINRKTKKVCLARKDCYMLQQKADTIHFQAVEMYKFYDEMNVNYNLLTLDERKKVLEENYECYALMGLGDYLKYEEGDSKNEFPNSKIRACYY